MINPGTNADNLLTAGAGCPENILGSTHHARHLEPVVGRGTVTGQGIGCRGSIGVRHGLFVGRGRLFVGGGGLFVSWSRGVVAGGWLSVLLGGSAVAVNGRGTVLVARLV